jgi:hypothetical protein
MSLMPHNRTVQTVDDEIRVLMRKRDETSGKLREQIKRTIDRRLEERKTLTPGV